MARRKLPSFGVLWMRHESLYTEVFSRSLSALADRPDVVGDEDAISESLCLILSQVCFDMGREGRREVRVPAWECPLQPVSEDERTGGKKRKRPDFTCSCCDENAPGPDEREIPFHIECKRLGKPTSPSWVLNKNYVTEGMKRFDCRSHQYGKRAPAGMMIGYMVSLCPSDILEEVNRHMSQHFRSWPSLAFSWGRRRVHSTQQVVTREQVIPRDFRLQHIWADLRHNYKGNSALTDSASGA